MSKANSNPLPQLLRQLSSAELTASALYVSLDLQTLMVSDYTVVVGTQQPSDAHSPTTIPPYEITRDSIAYHRLTPIFFCWIKSQLQLLQTLHHQKKLKADIFQNWRARYGWIKEYCRKKFGEEVAGLNPHSFFNSLDFLQIVEMTAALEMSDSLFRTTAGIFPRPVHFDDVSQPLQYSDEQIQELAGQITPNVYANWMGAVKIHYPEYCNAINTTASFLWIYVAWKMFIEIANLFSAVRRFEGIDYRLRDATVKSLMKYFTGVLKSTSLESFAEDTEERAGVNIREDFAA